MNDFKLFTTQMKRYRNFYILFLLGLIGFLFSFNNFEIKKVEAQVGFGYSCMINYASCPTGSVNLMQGLTNGSINVTEDRFSKSELVDAINRDFGGKAGRICLNLSQVSNNIIPLYYTSGDGSRERLLVNSVQGDLTNIANTTGNFATACGAGLTPQKDNQSGGVAGKGAFRPWGCCPSGYQFVSQKGASSYYEAQISSACCLIPPGTSEGSDGYPLYWNDTKSEYNRCTDVNDKPVWSSGTSGGKNVIFGSTDNSSEETQKKGFDLGVLRLTDSYWLKESTDPVAAPKICDKAAACASTNSDNTNIIKADNLREGGDKDACFRCFDQNAPIRYDQDNLYLCDKGTAKPQPLINGSISDTLAYLATDPTNQPLLASCRARGGIYIAIGCVDPTPTGILTGLIRIAFGIMGGVALVQLIIAGIYYQSGDEAKIKEARDKVIATLTGIAVLVFSILILRIIGVNILDVIPQGSI